MQINISTFGLLLSLLAVGMAFMLGCGRNPPGAAYNKTNVRRLRTAYNIYTRLNDMKGPASEQDFKEFLKTDLTAKIRLERIGITLDEIDEIFNSERDGQPFRVRYGLNGTANHAVVFEAEGVGGKRYVAFWDPIEVESDEYDEYWSGKKLAEENDTENN